MLDADQLDQVVDVIDEVRHVDRGCDRGNLVGPSPGLRANFPPPGHVFHLLGFVHRSDRGTIEDLEAHPGRDLFLDDAHGFTMGDRLFAVHVAGEGNGLNDASLGSHGAKLLVIEVAADVVERTGRGVRSHDRSPGQLDRLEIGELRRMRQVEHDAPLVGLDNRLSSEIAQPPMEPDIVTLARVGVGKLRMAVV